MSDTKGVVIIAQDLLAILCCVIGGQLHVAVVDGIEKRGERDKWYQNDNNWFHTYPGWSPVMLTL